MIRQCKDSDFETIFKIINDAAQAYKGIIPPDRWKEPYMPKDELRREMDDGVVFWGYEEGSELIGVVGIQDVRNVTLTNGSTRWRSSSSVFPKVVAATVQPQR